MLVYPLQDYITIRSDIGVLSVTQNETGWLDLAGFQDIVAFLDVKEFSGASAVSIVYQTSPSKDESLWASMTGTIGLVAGLTTTKILKDSATVPLARFVRWQLSATTPSGSWDAYFRIWLACNRAGKRNAIPLAADTRTRLLASEPSIPIQRRSSNQGGMVVGAGMTAGTGTGTSSGAASNRSAG
jgi:hypothetical protein